MSRSRNSLALRRRWILLSTLPAAALSACVTAPPVYLSASDCSRLIPAEWHRPVNSAPLPPAPTVGDWIGFADAQTAQLDIANARSKAALEILAECEATQHELAAQLAPKPWWHFW